MAKQGFKVIDSDLHLIEPPDVFEKHADAQFKDRVPAGLNDGLRDIRLIDPASGGYWGMQEMTRPNLPGGFGRQSSKDEDVYRKDAERGWTSQVQLEAMDAEGIDLAFMYPTRGLFAMKHAPLREQPDLAVEVCRAYNRWLNEFCAIEPSRMLGVAMVSPFDIGDAVEEAQRCVDQYGFKGIFFPASSVNERRWGDSYYDPLWEACSDLDISVGFHESGSSGVRQIGDRFNLLLRHVYSHSLEQMVTLGDLIVGGALERHPTLRVGFLEANCSWLPWLLWRLDEHVEMFGDIDGGELTMPPSAYFKRQCFVSVDCEESTVSSIVPEVGDDNIVFSTDYPHPDAKYPNGIGTFLKLDLSDTSRRKILWDNCARLYGVKSESN